MVRVNSGSTTSLTKCGPVAHTRILFAWFNDIAPVSRKTTRATFENATFAVLNIRRELWTSLTLRATNRVNHSQGKNRTRLLLSDSRPRSRSRRWCAAKFLPRKAPAPPTRNSPSSPLEQTKPRPARSDRSTFRRLASRRCTVVWATPSLGTRLVGNLSMVPVDSKQKSRDRVIGAG